MAMEISAIRNDYTKEYPQIDKMEKSDKNTEAKKVPQDEYINSGKDGNRPSGLYGLAYDENGKRKIVYDDSHKENDSLNGIKAAGEKEKAEKCTTNTDSVDKEIAKLKEEKKQIQQQIQNLHGDEKKRKELEQKLAQIENELSQKDNDSYRRQKAVTNSAG